MIQDAERLFHADNDARLTALLQILARLHLPFILQPFRNRSIHRDPRERGFNVIVKSEGTRRGANPLVVGAHFDAVYLRDGGLSPGMIDNASGAILLAHLAAALYKGDRNLWFVWFDLEEVGMQGAQHFVSTFGGPISAMINLDTIAYGDTCMFGPTSESESAFLREALAEQLLRHRIDAVSFPRFPRGDETAFISRGVPSLSIASADALEAHQLWLMLNGGASSGLRDDCVPKLLSCIHSHDDRVEQLDADCMYRMLSALIAFLQALVVPADEKRDRVQIGST
jgi:Zn-dependent M28 family amino/carboxypeptidase